MEKKSLEILKRSIPTFCLGLGVFKCVRKKKQIITSIILLSLFLIPTIAQASTEYFTESFENRNFSNWNYTSSGTGDSASVITNDPHSGNYHARIQVDGGDQYDKSYLKKTLSSGHDVIYYREYRKINNLLPAWRFANILSLRDSSSNILARLRLTSDGDSTYFTLFYRKDGKLVSVNSIDISTGHYYCLEVYVKRGGSTIGEVEFWVDGVSRVSDRGFDNDDYGSINTIITGIVNTNSLTPIEHYIDSVVILDNYNGLLETSTSTTTTNTSSTSTSTSTASTSTTNSVIPSTSTSSTSTTTPSNSALHVKGTHLEDGNGNTVYLQGAQVDWNERRKAQGHTWLAKNPYESWFTEADVQTMKAAGANYFEIHTIPFKYIMPTKNVLNTDYFKDWLDVWIKWATNNQMYVSIDIKCFSGRASWAVPNWIWSAAGYSKPSTVAQWESVIMDFFDKDVSAMKSNRQAFINAWIGIANRYKNNPYVLFSIFNEPLMGFNTFDSATEMHLGESYSRFMEDVVDGIHSTGAKNIIIINRHYATRYYQYYSNVQPVNRNGIIWEDHYYMTATHSFTLWKRYIDMYVNRIVKTFGKPLIIGEYGFDKQNYGKDSYPSTWLTQLQNQVNYLDSKGLCGRQWQQWGALEGEYYDRVYNYYTAQDSQSIQRIVI